jgi:hypothetical protein
MQRNAAFYCSMAKLMTPFFSKFPLTLLSAVLMAAAFYSALWAVSAMHPKSVACKALSGLFAEVFRCRQPYLAILLTIVFFGASITSAYLKNRLGKPSRRRTSANV